MSAGEQVLALAIRIGVNDGEAATKFEGLASTVEKVSAKWSNFGSIGKDAAGQLAGGLDSVVGLMSPLNVGLAAAGAAMTGFGLASAGALSALRSGGDFAEVRSGFRSLAESAGVSADAIVKSIAKISGGTLSMREAMESGSKAIRAGFSEDQIEAVYTFAKRYSEATGKGFQESADAISEAIMAGRSRTLKTYGLMATDIEGLFSELKTKTAEFGKGAFNFGDIETAITKQIGDLADVVGATWNAMLGDSVTGEALEGLVSSLMNLAEKAPELADAIGAPIIAVFDSIIESGSGLREVFGVLADFAGVDMITALKALGATILDTGTFIATGLNGPLWAATKYAELLTITWSKLAWVIGASETSKSLEDFSDKIGKVRIHTESLTMASDRLVGGLSAQDHAGDKLAKKHIELGGAIVKTGKAHEEQAEKATKSTKALADNDVKAEALAIKEQERADKRMAAIIAEDKKREESSKAIEKKLQQDIDNAKTWQERDEAIEKYNAQKKKEKRDNEDRYAAEQKARVEDEKRLFAERAKADEASAKAEQDNNASRLSALEKYAESAKKIKAGLGGAPDGSPDPSTAAMINDSEKMRQSAAALAASNNRLADILTAIQKNGVQMIIKILGQDAAWTSVIRKVIEECQIQAQTEGMRVAGV